jgi:hypothetical protein
MFVNQPKTMTNQLLQFVECRTGQIITAACVKDGRFYLPNQMRRSGQPDGRCLGYLCQIHPDNVLPGFFSGRFAPLNPAREAMAEPRRKQILAIRKCADELERELCLLYCQPPSTAPSAD